MSEVMECEMDVSQAAAELQQRLEGFEWLTAIAIGNIDGQDVIYVYLRIATRHPEIESLKRDGWHGYRVIVERVGRFSPAAKS